MRRSGRILTVLSLVCLATLSLAISQPQQDAGLHRRSLIERHAILAARADPADGGNGGNNNNNDDGANGGNAASGSGTSTAAGAPTSTSTTAPPVTTSTTAPTSRTTSTSAAPVSTAATSSSTSTSTTPSSTSTSSSTSSSSSTTKTSSTTTSTSTTSSSTTSSTASSTTSTSVASTTQAKTTAAQVAQGGVKTVTSTLQVAASSTSAETVATESVAAAAAAAKGASSNGFFSNKGAVAGTFTAVGLVVVAAVAFLFYRRQKSQRRYEDDEFFEKYPTANDAAPHAGADYDATTDPDAGHATQVASNNAYPPRDIHYGNNASYGDSYSGATPRPPKDNGGYNAHAANEYGDAGNYSSWLGPPPQAAGYSGGETDSRPSTQFAGVGAGFASNHMPQQYQSAHEDLLADDGQGAYTQGQYQGYEHQQDPYAGQQQYQDQAYAVTTATAHPFADPANVSRGYGATNAGGPIMARTTYDRESGDSFYGTGHAA